MGPKKRRTLQLAARIREAYVRIDQHVADGIEAHELKPSCRRGCSACCRQFVGCSAGEAAAILARYPGVVDEVAERLREDREVSLGLARAAGLMDGTVPGHVVRERFAPLWWDANRPCAFLAEDGACRVYEARPLACRAYLVASDPALCDSADVSDVTVLAPDYDGCIALLQHAAGEPMIAGHLPAIVLDVRKQMKG